MNRAVLVALGLGLVISSATALDLVGDRHANPAAAQGDPASIARVRADARAEQRDRIEARYQSERSECSGLGGVRRDACLVSAHANRGRALLAAAQPYEISN